MKCLGRLVLFLAAVTLCGCAAGEFDSYMQRMETAMREQFSGGSGSGPVNEESVRASMDSLATELQRQFSNRVFVNIQRGEEGVIIDWQSDAIFDPSSTAMKPGSYQEINRLAEVLLIYPDTSVFISAHTDSDGPEALNQTTSQRRAEIIRNTLLSQRLPAVRLTAQGFGESQPVVDNRTLAGKQQNRRIVITILPNKTNSESVHSRDVAL